MKQHQSIYESVYVCILYCYRVAKGHQSTLGTWRAALAQESPKSLIQQEVRQRIIGLLTFPGR